MPDGNSQLAEANSQLAEANSQGPEDARVAGLMRSPLEPEP